MRIPGMQHVYSQYYYYLPFVNIRIVLRRVVYTTCCFAKGVLYSILHNKLAVR